MTRLLVLAFLIVSCSGRNASLPKSALGGNDANTFNETLTNDTNFNDEDSSVDQKEKDQDSKETEEDNDLPSTDSDVSNLPQNGEGEDDNLGPDDFDQDTNPQNPTPELGKVTINPIADVEQANAKNLLISGTCETERLNVQVTVNSDSYTVPCKNGQWSLNKAIDLSEYVGKVSISASQETNVPSLQDQTNLEFNILPTKKDNVVAPPKIDSKTPSVQTSEKDGGDLQDKLKVIVFTTQDVDKDGNTKVLIQTSQDVIVKKFEVLDPEDALNDDGGKKEVTLNDNEYGKKKVITLPALELDKHYRFYAELVTKDGKTITENQTIWIEAKGNDKLDDLADKDVDTDESEIVSIIKGGDDDFAGTKAKAGDDDVDADFVAKVLKARTERETYKTNYKKIGFDYDFSEGDNDIITMADFDLSKYKGKIEHIEAHVKGRLMKEYVRKHNVFTTIWWKTDSINFQSGDDALKYSYADELKKEGIYSSKFNSKLGVYKGEDQKANFLFDKYWKSGNVFTKSLDLDSLLESVNETGELKFFYEDDAILDYVKINLVLKK